MDTFTRAGLCFDVTDAGRRDGEVVILLHGFPQDRHSWSGVVPVLAASGYRVLAPDQRGYSPGARPPHRRDYALAELAADVLALADAASAERFHLVGHDWGAAVAWYLAGRHACRVSSLTALSVPHPGAMRRVLFRSTQLFRSWYIGMFQVPGLAERMFGFRGGAAMRDGLVRDGLPPADARRYSGRWLTGPLNWYRAISFRTRIPAVEVPTLFVWSPGDRYITRAAAVRCGEFVRGRYRFEVLPGVSHWIPEQAPDLVAALVREHLG